jgi:hypothetical protein
MDYDAIEQERRRRTVFGRSHSSAFEKFSKQRSSSRRNGSKKRRNSSKEDRDLSFSPSSSRPTMAHSHCSPESPRLMTCFDTPDSRPTLLGSRNAEHWESFHQQFSDSEREMRRMKRHGSGRQQRKGSCLWSSLVRVMSWRCESPDARDDVGSAYEWSNQRSPLSFRSQSSRRSGRNETQHHVYIVS